MRAQTVTIEGSGPVRTIRLCRSPINALDAQALEEIGAAAHALAGDAETRIVVLASGIDGVFCSGGDLKFWQAFPKDQAQQVALAGRQAFARIARLGKPTIAAIDGHVVGDAIALALSCDLRLASSRASFRLPETRYGFLPGWGTLHQLAGTIGYARTMDMILTGRTVEANIALEWGLVSRVQPTETLAEELATLEYSLLSMSPTALSLAKTALLSGPWAPGATPEHETAAFIEAWGSDDWQEGISALLTKRSPRFAASECGDSQLPVPFRSA
jgi:enoyl-CoA hydratase